MRTISVENTLMAISSSNHPLANIRSSPTLPSIQYYLNLYMHVNTKSPCYCLAIIILNIIILHHTDGQSIQILKVTHNEIQVSIDRRWDNHDYNCTINNTDKIIKLSVSDGVTFAIPNLSPNTTYDIDCIGAEDQCLEVNTTVTTTATGNHGYSGVSTTNS